MSDKHEAKLKKIRAKGHDGAGKVDHNHSSESRIDSEVRESAGNVQEELAPFRMSANRAHQAQGRKG